MPRSLLSAEAPAALVGAEPKQKYPARVAHGESPARRTGGALSSHARCYWRDMVRMMLPSFAMRGLRVRPLYDEVEFG